MPTYLLHGFRWHRPSIRIHIILQDLEDAAPEWIMAPASSVTLLNSFYSMFDFLPPSSAPPASYPVHVPEKIAIQEEIPLPPPPPPKVLSKKNTRSMSSLRSLGRKKKEKVEIIGNGDRGSSNGNGNGGGVKATHYRHPSGSDTSKAPSTAAISTKTPAPEKPISFNEWSAVKLLEQYNPNDLESVSQPYAYVADYMIDVTLSASLTEEMAKYEAKVKENEYVGNTPGPKSPGTPGIANAENSGDLSARDVASKNKGAGWLEKLRDGLQNGEPVGWYVVFCGDEERRAPTPSLIDEEEEEESADESMESEELSRTPKSGGFRQFFRGKKSSMGQ